MKLLGKIKIHEIAKKMGLTSKEVLEKAKSLNFDVKSHLSAVTDEEAKKLEEELKKNNKGDQKNKPAKKHQASNKKDEPVIIRREVIISDEEIVKKEEEEKQKRQKEREKQLGFVERNKSKDFNIVYRNKQTKPLTVEEPKKETPKVEEKVVEKQEPKTEEVKEIVKPEQKIENKKIEKSERENMIGELNRKTTKQIESNKNEEKDFSKRNNNFNNRKDNKNFRNNNNNRDGYRNNNYKNNNNNFRNNNYSKGPRPMDERTIEKNIKNIMSSEVAEKEVVREYNKSMEKQKNNKYEENKTRKSAKASKRFSDEDINEKKLQDLKQTNSLSTMFSDQDGGMLDYYDLSTRRGKKNKKKNAKNQKPAESKQKIFKLTEITIPETISVKDLAAELKKTSSEVIKKLLGYGIMATINNDIDFDTAYLIAQEFGVTAKKKNVVKEEDILFDESEDKAEDLVPRAPVIVVMGHVDHGKTSLLDAIRSTNVIEGEAGGITQHIGAYQVKVNGRDITFLDTPGHEAFTSMRARGAQITDIAILVVAADDGVMPQTIEAINHAKAAEVPIIVAVNKCDKPGANPDKVLQQLTEHGLVPEAWGGETITVNVSALQGTGIDELLEYILLVAEVQDLKANPKAEASGVVIEANLDKGKGPVATLLVQNGTLRTGNCIVVGTACGRVRALLSDSGERIVKAEPSTPVEVLGLTEVPNAGDFFEVVKNEKEMKAIIEKRKDKERNKRLDAMLPAHMRREAGDAEGDVPQLNLIIKANTHGSAEAVSQAIAQFESKEIVTKIIHVGVGDISEADVMLASASNALILGFTVKEDSNALAAAEREGVTIKKYDIIYQILEDIEKTMISLLSPEVKEITTGQVEIRQIFTIGKIQKIAGCYVTEGKINRNDTATIYRDGKEIFKGAVDQLKRFKDDVKEVAQGFECGLSFVKFNDIQEGDIVKFTTKQEIERSELE